MFTPDEIASHLAQNERMQAEIDVEVLDKDDDPFRESPAETAERLGRFNLIKELQAQGADPNPPGLPNAPDHILIDDNDLKEGKLDYAAGDLNDLQHGVFVIDTGINSGRLQSYF